MINTSRVPALTVARSFEGSRDEVFRAFTDPAAIPRWFGGQGETDTTRIVELDLRVGGRYVFQGSHGGHEWDVRGVYREVAIPERLVFTWTDSMDGQPSSGDTLVTVVFRDLGGRTEIVLTHENDATEKTRREHEGGWKQCFDLLARVVAEGEKR
jgi:uncharacterized protein YndB with AHSA1/START domain